MRRIKKFAATVLLAVFVAGILGGCMDAPTAPTHHAQTASTATSRAAAPDGLIGSLVGLVVNLVVKVLNIVGSIGGSLTNGRWRVDVPAGAVDGTATVSVGAVSSTSPNCQLEITPADKNHFLKPVLLTVNCSSVPTETLRTYAIFWYNPTTKTWVPVTGSTVDLTNKRVSAPLQHFSNYAVGPVVGGKAGW